MGTSGGGKASTKAARLLRAHRLYLAAPDGLSDADLARALGVDRVTANRYRRDLGTTHTGRHGRYTLAPSAEDVADAILVLRRAGVEVRTEEAAG